MEKNIKIFASDSILNQQTNNKTDIEDEIDAIRDKICEEINGMTVEEKTAYFTQKAEKQRQKYNFCFVHSAEENITKDFFHAQKTTR